ncbi:conserved hypothetical protein [Xenorhabdus bovienii str. Jollieti]|nr:conserved hypothetical protein [Xenorhabdus bovienii str. Jollieti]
MTRPNTYAAKTAIPEMTLCHLEQPTTPVGWLYEPSIMIISSPFKAVTSMRLSVC